MRKNSIAFVMSTFSLNNDDCRLKSFKFFGKALLDIVLQYEAIFRGRFLRIK